ncbi:MAG: Flp family type IVb pilin [Dehalococcoidia bacterium]
MSYLKMVRDYARAYSGREEGQGMVEYTLIVGTISLVIIAAFLTGGIEAAINGLSNDIATDLGAAPAATP